MFECPVCHKVLKTKGTHMFTHTSEGWVPANRGKKLNSASRDRMSKAQNKRFSIPIVCGVCGKTLKCMGGHMGTHKESGCIPWNKGSKGVQTAWNKGITKDMDDRVRAIGEKRKGIPRPLHVRMILAECSRKRAKESPEFFQMLYQKSKSKRPTSLEKRFMELCEQYNLPFKYVGDGYTWIARMNPDFISTKGDKLVVEVLGRYWHTEEETNERIEKFSKYGYSCIPIWEEELLDDTLVLQKLGVMEEEYEKLLY